MVYDAKAMRGDVLWMIMANDIPAKEAVGVLSEVIAKLKILAPKEFEEEKPMEMKVMPWNASKPNRITEAAIAQAEAYKQVRVEEQVSAPVKEICAQVWKPKRKYHLKRGSLATKIVAFLRSKPEHTVITTKAFKATGYNAGHAAITVRRLCRNGVLVRNGKWGGRKAYSLDPNWR